MTHSIYLNRRSLLIYGAASGLVSCGGPSAKASAEQIAEKQAGRWTAGVSLPIAVQEIYPCAHKGRLHLSGGFVASNGRITGPTNAHQSWSPGEKAWTAETPLPTARHHPHMISFKGRLLSFAGFESPEGQLGWIIQKTGWILSETGTSWGEFADLPAPAAEAVIGITGDGNLHLVGGRSWATEGKTGGWRDHIDTDHHFVLSELSGKWERAAPCPYKRNSAAGGVLNGQLHVVGGRQVGGGNLDYHTAYDHKTDRWHKLAPMPNAQGGLAAAILGGKLYAFGGEFFDNGGGVYPNGWVYNPASDNWDSLPDMPHPRHGLGAVTLDGAIYVIGGALQASGVETSALVELFRP